MITVSGDGDRSTASAAQVAAIGPPPVRRPCPADHHRGPAFAPPPLSRR
ncbi:hypothetical protein ACMZ5F_03885 [Streptomyces rhizosphaericola]